MRETSKCVEFRRQRGDFNNFLKGTGIDIGAGPDPLKIPEGTVRAWDMPDGDAQLMKGVADSTYDFVYASHCLEHMRDVREALVNWLRICKPGGHLYIVVPEYIIYEKMMWPSMYNGDHKQSFSFLVTRNAVNRPNHWNLDGDLLPLFSELGADPLRSTFEDYGFNYNAGIYDQTQYSALSQLCVVAQKRQPGAAPKAPTGNA